MEIDFNINTRLWAIPFMVAIDDFGSAIAISILCFHWEIYDV